MGIKKYDYVCVGAGLFNSVFARNAVDNGKSVLIIDRRSHIAGNCYSENIEGIEQHRYGPHILHTNNHEVWGFIKKYTDINDFIYSPKVIFKDKLFSFPLNMMTFYQLWNIKSPIEAIEKIKSFKNKNLNIDNFEEYCLSEFGKEIYEIFIYGYTKKQWGKDPKQLPSSIIKRLPFRFNYNENYFNDKFQGIPSNGYTCFFKNLLKGIPKELNCDYFENREYLDKIAGKIIFSGKIDEFFEYKYGDLEYRSLKFETEKFNMKNYQGTAVINYTDEEIPFTRSIEHKFFDVNNSSKITYVTKEFPQEYKRDKEAFYPIRNNLDQSQKYLLYKTEADKISKKFIFKGRLAEFVYRDMCPTIKAALDFSKTELNKVF